MVVVLVTYSERGWSVPLKTVQRNYQHKSFQNSEMEPISSAHFVSNR